MSRNKWKRNERNNIKINKIKSSLFEKINKIDKLTLHLKQLEKEKKKSKISRRTEIIKIWAEINEKEMKETIVKINKSKSWLFEK